MKRILLLFWIFLFFLVPSVQATTIAAPMNTTLDGLIAFAFPGSGNSFISQDKLYSDFSYSSATNPASTVNAQLVFSTVGVQDIHGWIFTEPNHWTGNFTLSYKISVAPAFPSVVIVASADQIFDGLAGPTNTVTMADTQSGPPLLGTLNMNLLTTGGQTAQLIYGTGVASVTTTSVATIPTGKFIDSYEQRFFETAIVPEPSMLLLLGCGLLALGLFRRRIK